jgi:hypothetical protein
MSASSPLQVLKRLAFGPRITRASITGNRAFWQKPHFTKTIKMSSIGGAGVGAGFYAVVSSPAQIVTQPEGTEDKAHHLKDGKGFTNPWDSYVPTSTFQVFKTLLWSVLNLLPKPRLNN